MFDKALVVLVALALALMMPATLRQPFSLSTVAVEDGLSAATQPLHQHCEESPSSPCEESDVQPVQVYEEDDALFHEEQVFIFVGLSLELSQVPQLEPDSLHTREFERPPLRRA